MGDSPTFHDRSIPAHAGEPAVVSLPTSRSAVYPRPRGGTGTLMASAVCIAGLSPPTRGNLLQIFSRGVDARSIPAHAGEPHADMHKPRRPRVYPRPRGGTPGRTLPRSACFGLSPPTRGNPSVRHFRVALSRSIPAHAGEPVARYVERDAVEVYPRPRGGTQARTGRSGLSPGLSPPTRGNPEQRLAARFHVGSIPAHAGEPPRIPASSRPRSVYPRPRGGTVPGSVLAFGAWGLSPPTRGNPDCVGAARRRRRSIPAHAGEPKATPSRADAETVYPRPRGGTAPALSSPRQSTGLSPPTRGNRPSAAAVRVLSRSIPAHAGEPPSLISPIFNPPVYPRPRGGTSGSAAEINSIPGLSPPTRGNLV